MIKFKELKQLVAEELVRSMDHENTFGPEDVDGIINADNLTEVFSALEEFGFGSFKASYNSDLFDAVSFVFDSIVDYKE